MVQNGVVILDFGSQYTQLIARRCREMGVFSELMLFDTPLEEISEIAQAMHDGTNPMPFKKKLAHTITTWLHGSEEADAAQSHFENTVQQKQIPDDIPEVKLASTKMTVPSVPCAEIIWSCM